MVLKVRETRTISNMGAETYGTTMGANACIVSAGAMRKGDTALQGSSSFAASNASLALSQALTASGDHSRLSILHEPELAEHIIAALPFGIGIFDVTDAFHCLGLNQPLLALLNRGDQIEPALLGTPLEALLDPIAAARIRTLFIQVRETGQPVVVEEFPAVAPPDLATRWFTLSIAPLMDAEEHIIALLGSAVEITARKQMEREAQERAAELESIFASLTAAVIVFDRQGTVIRLNPAARMLYDQTGGSDYYQLPMTVRTQALTLLDARGNPLPPERWPGPRVLHGEWIENEDVQCTTAAGQMLVLSLSGVPLFDSAGAISGGITIYQGVTERRALERRTHSSLEALLAMAQAIVTSGNLRDSARGLAQVTCEVLGCRRVGIMRIEPETALIIPLAVYGLSPEEEERWWAMQPPNARFGEGGDPEQIARFAAGEVFVIDMTQPPFHEQPNPFGITTALFLPMRLDGRMVGVLSLDHGGPPHHYTEEEIALAQGVADLAALVVEREQLQAAHAASQAKTLALAETNTRMHTFLGVAGHELRTPITSIKTSVQISSRVVQQVIESSIPPELLPRLQRAAHTLESVNGQADKLNRFITDLMDVTRIQAGTLEMHPRKLELRAIVQESVDQLRLDWPGRMIVLEVPRAALWMHGDPDRLGQVVSNLATNALKYSLPDQEVEVRLLRRPHEVRLEVTDHGTGLTETQQSQLFKAFGRVEGIERQSGSGVGLGLGLFICKTIVERMGGTIGVTSQREKGSTFWCRLPIAEGE